MIIICITTHQPPITIKPFKASLLHLPSKYHGRQICNIIKMADNLSIGRSLPETKSVELYYPKLYERRLFFNQQKGAYFLIFQS